MKTQLRFWYKVDEFEFWKVIESEKENGWCVVPVRGKRGRI